MEFLPKAVRLAVGGAAIAAGLLIATGAVAQTKPEIAGKIEWGVWVDDDGCMHWWADGGLEGYMLDRVNPKTGKPVCLKRNTCLVENTDTLFATDEKAQIKPQMVESWTESPDKRLWTFKLREGVKFHDGTPFGADDVIDHCRNQIAGYKCPRSVDFRDTPLPLSGAGKVLKRDLREPYWQGFTRGVN